jgi:hypothetical protein
VSGIATPDGKDEVPVKRLASTEYSSCVNSSCLDRNSPQLRKETKMSVKKISLVVLVLSTLLLAVGVGPRMTGAAQAPTVSQESDLSGITIPYSGRLADDAGEAVADGAYDFTFALYSVESGGEPIWSEVQDDVTVRDGVFNAMLGSAGALSHEALDQGEYWLAVGVRGPDEDSFTPLTPRQALSAVAPASPLSPSAPSSNGMACPHDHFGEVWSGSSGSGLQIATSDSGANAFVASIGPKHGASNNAVYAETATGNGVYGRSNIAGKAGVYGYNSAGGYGVSAMSENSHSVYVPGAGGSGVYVAGAATHGVHVEGAGAHGIDVASAGGSGVKVYSAGNDGVRVDSANWSGVYVASSGADALRVQTAGQDGLRFFDAMGRDYIRAGDDGNLEFRVADGGGIYTDAGIQGPADFAEMVAAEDRAGAYEPGDVLVVSVKADRSAALSSEPYSTLVLGVYSEKPGFVGSSHPMEDRRGDEIPIAVVGIVPCKVSAENGAIHRGDLLVTSSTLGHAMRAEEPLPGTILGKALEPLETGTGVIEVLVTLQ